LVNVEGLTINFNYSKITTDNLFAPQGSAYVFMFRNCRNIIVNDPVYTQTGFTTLSFTQGGQFFTIFDAGLGEETKNIQINNAKQNWGISFLEVASTVVENTIKNITVLNANVSDAYYGMVFQMAGDNVFARNFSCTGCGRVYFPYNVKNHDVWVSSTGGASNSPVLLKMYANPVASRERNSLSNIKINVDNPDFVALPTITTGSITLDLQQIVTTPTVSGAVTNGGLIRLTVSSTANMATGQTWYVDNVGGVPNATGSWVVTVINGTTVDLQGSTFAGAYTAGGYMNVPGAVKDVEVTVNSQGTNRPAVFLTQKHKADASIDLDRTSYVIENLSIRGVLQDLNNGRPAIDLFNNDGYALGSWASDTIRNITLKDLILKGSSSSVLIDATNIASNLIIKNVNSPATIPWTITGAGANTRIENVIATGITDRQAVTPSAAAANQYMTGISTAGVITRAQPSAANLSDGNTGTGAVVHATSPAITTPLLTGDVLQGIATAPALGDSGNGIRYAIQGAGGLYGYAQLMTDVTGNNVEMGRFTFGSPAYSGADKRTAVIRSRSLTAATTIPFGSLEFFVNNGTALAQAANIGPNGGLGVGTTTDPGAGAILANTTIKATTGYSLTNPLISSTAPTATTFCTSPSIPATNGTAAFTINVGTACATSTGTITLSAATTGWVCDFHNITTPAANIVEQTGGTTTTVTMTNYARTTGVASNWTASDVIRAKCVAY
jgi:hypothetical protein